MAYNYEEKLIEAIQYIVDNAVSKAPYDKTIQGTIVSCVDSTIGKYKVKYQDSTFFAYSNNIDIKYSKNTDVYILVPGNDMSQEKTILGTTKRLGIDYISDIQEEDIYDIIGNNCIEKSDEYTLCSYKTEQKVLYNYEENNNKLLLNIDDINNYIKTNKYFTYEADIRTTLPKEQQMQGNYGIIFELAFEEDKIENFILDVNTISGNPYLLTNKMKQKIIFNIDNDKFIRINKISIFCYNFPNQKEDMIDDIFISNICLYGLKKIEEKDINTTSISFVTPKGNYFNEKDGDKTEKNIQAIVKVKGKKIDINSQQLEYYWFKENLKVTVNSETFGYNQYGGNGWECLNAYNIIDTETKEVKWVAANNELIFTKENNKCKNNIYKCVVIYNNTIIEKEFIIKNYDSNYDITIDIDSENNIFYYDVGTPSIQCIVNNEDYYNNNDYTFQWAQIDNDNRYILLSDTIEQNIEYNNTRQEYDRLQEGIKLETILPNSVQDLMKQYLTTIEKYDIIRRVDRNKVEKIQIKDITNYSIFKCEVYYKNKKIGSSEIRIINSFEVNNNYSLIINNGNQVYKYDERGNFSRENKINPLSFSLYNPKGELIDNKFILKDGIVTWKVPVNNTIIKISDDYDEYIIERNDDYIIYQNIAELVYTIDNLYSATKINNIISLSVEYNNLSYVRDTSLLFIKEGDNGTNGTNFIMRLAPNPHNDEQNIPKLVCVNNGLVNFTPAASGVWFKVEFWKDGKLIFNSPTSGSTDEGKNITLKWEILKNKYTSSISDISYYEINESTGKITLSNTITANPANLIKCTATYEGIKYYAVAPIITSTVTDSNFTISFNENSGFLSALYTTDGLSPSYNNNNPFEIKVTKKIDDIIEDVSELEISNHKVNYTWSTLGVVYNNNSKAFENTNLLQVLNIATDLKRNQKKIWLASEFNGQCVTNAISVSISDNSGNIGNIHIPIYLSLNRYGNANLNGWDGNSISIDEDGGFILAPQVGAGEKNSDNSFTGVLMGKVQESGKYGIEEGLFGYYQGKRTFNIDAETGTATFGMAGKGQIIIDPTNNIAKIESGNYSTSAKTGLRIDFTTPEIRFGNGKFVVGSDGKLKAQEVEISGTLTAGSGSTIGPWTVTNTAIYNGKSSYNSSSTGIYLGTEGISLGSRFKVSSGGTLEASSVRISGTLTADSGSRIGPWTVTDTRIYNDNIELSTNGLIVGNTKLTTYDLTYANGKGSNAMGVQIDPAGVGVYRKVHDKYNDDYTEISFGAMILNTLDDSGYIIIDQHQVLTSASSSSDIRLKTNIRNTKVNALERINQIQLKEFNWKENNNFESIGFIAQDMEKISKNYIEIENKYDRKRNKIGEQYNLRFLPLIATNTKGIQELYQMIIDLQNEVKELKGE